MKAIVDLILLIALDENISYEERRNRIAKIIGNNYKVYGEPEKRIDRDNDYDPLQRPNLGNAEGD